MQKMGLRSSLETAEFWCGECDSGVFVTAIVTSGRSYVAHEIKHK